MKKAVVLLILILCSTTAFGQQQDETFDFSTYKDMRAEFGKLYKEGNFQEGARLLEWALSRFPDNVLANAYNLAITYMKLQQYDKTIGALNYALDHDVWFNKFMFENKMWEPLKQVNGFENILTRNEEARQGAQKKAKSRWEVVFPEGYDQDKKYPLFIALHGGGGNIDGFRNVWTSEKLDKEFITVFVQSSQVISMDGFNWTENIEISKREIAQAYEAVCKDYAITKSEIIIGGFSSGGVAALEVVLCNTIPVTGFVVLCPAKPESFSEESVLAATKNGLRGTILSTEMDPRLTVQKEIVEVLVKAGFEHRFVVTPNVGHWIPDDLNIQIDDSITHIRNRPE